MATYQDRKGKVFKTRAEASASNKAMGISKGSIDVSSPMSSDDLKADERPFDIPDVPEPTATTGLEGAIQSNTDSFVADLEARRKASEEQSDQTFADYVESKLGTKGETELTADAYSKGRVNPLTGKRESVDDIQYELDDINQQILVEQNALRRTVENIEKKGGGLAMGANTEVLNATRESLRKQADLSIIQLGIQGRFDSAKTIADRAVSVQLEQDKIKNETLKEIADRNWDEFTEDEKREFDTKQKDRERKLDAEEQKLKDIYALGLDYLKEGGDPATAREIFNSKSVAEAAGKTGNVLGSTARLQRQKLTEEIRKLTTPVDGSVLTGKDKFDAQLNLAKAFNDRTGDFRKSSSQIQTIRTLSKDATDRASRGESIAAASQGIITAFNKLLDPTSVVRESEYARSAEGLALISRVEGQYSRLTQGGAGITADDLQEFSDTAETLLRGYENSAIDEAQLIIEQAIPAGLDVQQIVPQSVLQLMESRFVEAVDSTEIGGTFTVGGKVYEKVAEDDFQEKK